MGVAKKVTNENKCYHCGADCDLDSIEHDNKSFCCQGCATVYDLLKENDLCTYYDLENTPGISFKKTTTPSDLAYLDDPDVINALIEFQEEDFCKVRFSIPQIHCQSCLWLLEKMPSMEKGIKNTRVFFMKKEVLISFDKRVINLKEIVHLLNRLGYAPLIRLENLDKTIKPKLSNKLSFQIGVAGFCFGNIMLLSFPSYFNDTTNIDPAIYGVFKWLSIALALPALLIGGKGYLVSAYQSIRNKGLNIDVPIALGMVTLLLVSVSEIVFQHKEGYLDSLSGLIFFLLLGKIFQQKTFNQMSFERNYKAYFPISTSKIEGSKEFSVPITKVETGNRLKIRNEELIPADALLLTSNALLDYSFVTGESRTIPKVAGEKLYAGGRLKGNAIEVEVIKKPSQSYLTQLWNDYGASNSNQQSFERITDKIGKWFTLVVLTIATMTLIYWLPQSTEIAVNSFAAVLIIACPCALALAAPFTLGNLTRIFGRNKLFIKNTEVVEKMADITQIVFDKTGTLTDAAKNVLKYEGTPLNKDLQLALSSLCDQSNHPISRGIKDQLPAPVYPLDNFKEYPGRGIEGLVNGKHLLLASEAYVSELGIKCKYENASVILLVDQQVTGAFKLCNSYRPRLQQSITRLSSKYKLSTLSGDNEQEQSALRNLFGSKAEIRFKQSPFDKKNAIISWQEEDCVMMLGDGLNDAGALAQSDVGVAITEDSSNFTPASDAILYAQNLDMLPHFLQVAKKGKLLVYTGIGLSFAYNIVGLLFAVQGLLSPVISAILMPLSSISIVAFALASTHYTAKRHLKTKAR